MRDEQNRAMRELVKMGDQEFKSRKVQCNSDRKTQPMARKARVAVRSN